MVRNKPKQRSNKRLPAAKEAEKRNIGSLLFPGHIRFAAAFVICSIVMYALVNMLPPSYTGPLNEHTAATLGLALNASGIPASVFKDTVSEGSLAFRIVPECTSLFTSGLLICFIGFYQASLRQKAAGLAIGIPALYVGNLARLTATFMVSRYDRRFFEIFHVYLGQVFTICLVIAACVLWLKWVYDDYSNERITVKAVIFLARFVAISGCLFLVWMKAQHWYIWCIDRVMVYGFSLFDYRIDLAHNNTVYYETFSIAVFSSLVLAVRTISWMMKIKWLSAGLAFLFCTHLLHRIDNALMAYFQYTSILIADLILLAVGQYLLPAFFLIFMILNKRYSNSEI